MITALIVDDESKSRENLKIMIEDFCENVNVVALASSVAEALEMQAKHHPELVFLDIQMNRETGFDFLNTTPITDFEVIFTTAYSEYAIEAIKFSAIDYLLKPIDITDLRNAIKKAEQRKNEHQLRSKIEHLLDNIKVETTDSFRLTLPTEEGLEFVNFKEIIYCSKTENSTNFYMKNGSTYTASKAIKEYDELLNKYGFFRIHATYLVNIREITKYIRGEGGYVIMSNGNKLDVSSNQKDSFLEKVSNNPMT